MSHNRNLTLALTLTLPPGQVDDGSDDGAGSEEEEEEEAADEDGAEGGGAVPFAPHEP